MLRGCSVRGDHRRTLTGREDAGTTHGLGSPGTVWPAVSWVVFASFRFTLEQKPAACALRGAGSKANRHQRPPGGLGKGGGLAGLMART